MCLLLIIKIFIFHLQGLDNDLYMVIKPTHDLTINIFI